MARAGSAPLEGHRKQMSGGEAVEVVADMAEAIAVGLIDIFSNDEWASEGALKDTSPQ